MADITVPGVFLAGLFSFLSPCVLPLVPPYLTYLAGTTLDEISGETIDRTVRRRAVVSALVFMAGLATVFISLGATASLVGSLLISARRLLAQWLVGAANAGLLPMGWATSVDPFALLAGVIIITMGLHFLGVFRIAVLFRQARFESRATPGPLGAYLMGLAFAFGWTPCIGPVLATVLAVAGRQASVGQGVLLLAIYTLGLGLPFVVAAFAMNPFMRFLRAFRAHLGTVEKVMGGLLVVAGLAFITGGMADFSIWLQSTFPILSKLG
ncbi:cytochrome c biogenesis CcdA family protein [Labrys okinawensis]|uniref:cytochrome c biogenesis CcdA family protein n=1 Tax=Labrys okinawensis TaxID=346911 RepID=UPI0039BD532B